LQASAQPESILEGLLMKSREGWLFCVSFHEDWPKWGGQLGFINNLALQSHQDLLRLVPVQPRALAWLDPAVCFISWARIDGPLAVIVTAISTNH
jgi:hypothetical protein